MVEIRRENVIAQSKRVSWKLSSKHAVLMLHKTTLTQSCTCIGRGDNDMC